VKRCVGYFTTFLVDVPDISKVGAEDLRQFLSTIRDSPIRRGPTQEKEHKLSPTSVNTYARAIKSFWSWLEQEGLIKQNSLALVQAPKKPKTIPQVYSEEELKAIMNAVSDTPRDKAII